MPSLADQICDDAVLLPDLKSSTLSATSSVRRKPHPTRIDRIAASLGTAAKRRLIVAGVRVFCSRKKRNAGPQFG